MRPAGYNAQLSFLRRLPGYRASDMTRPIPFFSAQAANAGIDLLEPVKRVIDSHWYILGQEVTEFEKEFAAFVGVAHCVTVANGTDALELALRAIGVGPGDSVLTCANAGFYASTALHAIGATPVYIDIDPQTLTMSATRLEQALEHIDAKAIVATHLYGQLAAIERLVEIAAARGVPLLEDCAQAHGAERGGRQAGSFGTIGTFSFYPTKNLGAIGDGGAIVCQDQALALKVKQLRQYGWTSKYRVEVAGGRNSRLDEIQAAILRAKLPQLCHANAERQAIARRYNEAFSDLPLERPSSMASDYVAHLYVIRVQKRDAFRAFLAQQGVSTDIHYPVPDHLQSVNLQGHPAFDLAQSEKACASVVSLPCYPGLTAPQVEAVIAAVRVFFEQ